jgi:acyl dehydratase
MFYEDIPVGHSTALGETVFSREAILAYGKRFDPRIVVQAEDRAPLAASGLHVAAAGMRRLVDTRGALRAAMAARGETLPQLGVSPGFKDMRWPFPVWEGELFRIPSRRCRNARPPSGNGASSATSSSA